MCPVHMYNVHVHKGKHVVPNLEYCLIQHPGRLMVASSCPHTALHVTFLVRHVYAHVWSLLHIYMYMYVGLFANRVKKLIKTSIISRLSLSVLVIHVRGL